MIDMRFHITVNKPLLPRYESISGYLKEIDANRWYSNNGPLLQRFEARLASLFDIKEEHIACLVNGTQVLIATLQALNIPKGCHIFMPSWTFVGTAAAVVQAGFTPYFVDVDAESGVLSQKALKKAFAHKEVDFGAIVVVAPFGKPVNTSEWKALSKEMNLPVIVDGASAFDALQLRQGGFVPSRLPVMISLHATKAFGIGEGGMLISHDTELVARIKSMSNFGFDTSHKVTHIGSNAKLSEYHSAVGLAALDDWQGKREALKNLTQRYIEECQKNDIEHMAQKECVTSTFNIRLTHKQIVNVRDVLSRQYIETRHWWGGGCHVSQPYGHFPCDEMPATEVLSAASLGLPFYLGIEEEHIINMMRIIKQSSCN